MDFSKTHDPADEEAAFPLALQEHVGPPQADSRRSPSNGIVIRLLPLQIPLFVFTWYVFKTSAHFDAQGHSRSDLSKTLDALLSYMSLGSYIFGLCLMVQYIVASSKTHASDPGDYLRFIVCTLDALVLVQLPSVLLALGRLDTPGVACLLVSVNIFGLLWQRDRALIHEFTTIDFDCEHYQHNKDIFMWQKDPDRFSKKINSWAHRNFIVFYFHKVSMYSTGVFGLAYMLPLSYVPPDWRQRLSYIARSEPVQIALRDLKLKIRDAAGLILLFASITLVFVGYMICSTPRRRERRQRPGEIHIRELREIIETRRGVVEHGGHLHIRRPTTDPGNNPADT